MGPGVLATSFYAALTALVLVGVPVPLGEASGPWAGVADPTPAALVVAWDGLVVRACPDDNAALDCSRLAPADTVFPAWGAAADRAAMLQALGQHFANFEVILGTERPPPFVPYQLAVVGGTSSLLGSADTSCGMATLQCAGVRRNLMSFAFAASCEGWEDPGRVADVIAQEAAHNLGLEHVNASSDLMFPTLSSVEQTFRDECLPLITSNYDTAWLCPEEHLVDCPAGDQQNAHAELLRRVGPRRGQPPPPEIVSLVPVDGAVFDVGEPIAILADIHTTHDGLGLRWTLELAPADSDPPAGASRCTNAGCDAVEQPWPDWSKPRPFVELTDAVEGEYAVRLEVADVYGATVVRTTHFRVGAAPGGEGSGSTGDAAPPAAAADGCACGMTAHPPRRPSGAPLLTVTLGFLGRRRRP
jgi:MYXO-CTERM domain-containing protein